MSKFFIPKENIKEDYIIIDSDDVNHITKVLRLKAGDEIICCDGAGFNYTAIIENAEKKRVECRIVRKCKAETEPNIHVTLIQGIPKASKMDYIIQKTTELGISEIYPCEMSRCVAKVDNEKKIERWNKIANEAAKQSGRGVVPTVHAPINFNKAVELLKNADVAFVPYECAEQRNLKSVLSSANSVKNVVYMIGPEGGFDAGEIEKISTGSIPVISLGKRILRTETAGEAVLSMVMYELGDINL